MSKSTGPMSKQLRHRPSVLQDSVQYVKGVGPSRARRLAKLGVNTIEDCLGYFPRRYEDRSRIVRIADAVPGESQMIAGQVVSVTQRRVRPRLHLFQALVRDASGTMTAIWFNQPYVAASVKQGARMVFTGKVSSFRGKPQMESPEYERLADSAEDAGGGRPEGASRGADAGSPAAPAAPGDSLNVGRLVPVYGAAKDMSQRYLRQVVWNALEKFLPLIGDPMPPAIRETYELPPLKYAYRHIHFPDTDDAAQRARHRFIFEEFLYLQMGLAMRRQRVSRQVEGIAHAIDGPLLEQFRKTLPFTLTEGQEAAVEDLFRDLGGPSPMYRLLQGDVGSGKTLVAAHAMVVAVQNGYQVSFLVPTEILAEQHALTLRRWLEPLGLETAVLVSGLPAKRRHDVLQKIKRGLANVVIGTHALLQEGVEFRQLGLAIIDEQHKFGVVQRATLTEKGDKPDVLVMTATPIPRTLALTLYGDLDVTTIPDLPPGRRPIATRRIADGDRERAYETAREHVAAGRQAFIVYPLVDEVSVDSDGDTSADDDQDGGSGDGTDDSPKSRFAGLRNAVRMARELQETVFPEFRVGLLHGKLPSEEKERTMRQFAAKEIQVLVATVIVEVGIDVPNATVMLIEHADRFGLSQLHQLRGRIGRGEHDSVCLLVADPTTEHARARLDAMVATSNGFEIAERDLRLRGPGEFLGTRQHGLPELRVGDLLRDLRIMESARKEAFRVVEQDPDLAAAPHRGLRAGLLRRFPDFEKTLAG